MEPIVANYQTSRQSLTAGNGRTAPSFADCRKVNPVLLAFEQELGRFVKYMRKKAELGKKWKKPDEEAYARGSNTLYNLWNAYEPRLPQDYYLDRLLNTGDFLYAIKEYKLAEYHCYGRYSNMFKQKGATLERAAECDMEGFQEMYLSQGLEHYSAILMLRSVLGEAICSFYVRIAEDTKLQNPETCRHCVCLLKVLRVITQMALHKEEFCWLVYNGTVHMYSISRHVMAFGHSSKVLEFLLWASVCMESSIPLLTVKYLPWRSTLYTAVCQCYHDIKAPMHAEMFAKRGLNKVNELEDIEKMSTSEPSPETDAAFRQARAKMQIMVFRRIVFETRKRPKGLLRPKTKPNLKDTIHQPWPRTPTERLLADTLQGTAAQFLAILEALSEPHRRTLHCEGPTPEADDTVSDVVGELFFAGMELVAGGGGPRHQHAIKHTSEVNQSVSQLGNTTLMELVAKGANGVPVFALVKFVKRAFSFEQWETFDALVEPALELLSEYGDVTSLTDKKSLELMLALEPFYSSSRKVKKTFSTVTEDGEEGKGDKKGESTTHVQGSKTHVLVEELVRLADVIQSCGEEPYRSAIIAKDVDMIVDASLFLWTKCKPHFQKVISSALESCRQILNDAFAHKWLYMLNAAHHAMSWSSAASFDPILCAELALKLALVLEYKAGTNESSKGGAGEPDVPSGQETVVEQADIKEEKSHPAGTAERPLTTSSEASRYSSNMADIEGLGRGPGARGLLLKAREVLEQGVEDVSRAREAVVDTSGQTIADVSWMKLPATTNTTEIAGETVASTMSDSMVKAVHMELLFTYHRVAVKLATFGENPESKKSSMKAKMTQHGTIYQVPTESELLAKCNKNALSKAMFLMHKAGCAVTAKGLVGTEEQTQLLQESMELIKKAQQQDRKLMSVNKVPRSEVVEPSDVPGFPLLLFKSSSLMVLRPAPFAPKNGEKTVWFRLFARCASGNNVKVRLNDYQLQGTGEETPATENCKFHVKGLKANQKYVFAVAAYNACGQIIGGSIGATSRPILATHSLPCLMAWGYLAQIAYTTGVLNVAKAATSVLLNHFVKEEQPEGTTSSIQTAGNDLLVTLKRLDEERLHESSPVLVRQFLQSVFISVDIAVREGMLFCDSLCDNGPLYNGQVSRLEECKRLLLAIQVAGWLNDGSLCLQAIVQCYGLLAPMIHQKIPAKPVIQILLRCHAVLQEIPSLSRHRKQSSTSDSISHMVATMTYYIAKVLQMWGEQNVGSTIVELGKKMLNLDTAPDSSGSMVTVQEAAALAAANIGGAPPPPKKKKNHTKKPKVKETKFKGEKDHLTTTDGQNEELKALETYMLKLSQKALHRTEDEELTGSEDPSVLNSCVSTLPVQQAYKEVVKFKRRTRFLGFYVQVLAKAIHEGLTESVLEWNSDTMNWLSRRNELLLANKPTLVRQAATAAGPEDEKLKKFATAVVEFGKPPTRATRTQYTRQAETVKEGNEGQDEEIQTRIRQETTYRPTTYKSLVPTTVSRKTARRMKGKTAEEIDMIKAGDTIQQYLPEFWRASQRRRKLRGVSQEELPWRAQMNILMAGANLEVFLDRVDSLTRLSATREQDNPIFRPSFMDPGWFGFATSGTLIVSWSGNPTAAKHISPDAAKTVFSGSGTETVYSSPAGTSGRLHPRASQLSQGEGARTGSRLTTVSERETTTSSKSPLFYLRNVFALLHRAMVLAHRGKYWTLLQNACRSLWNAAQTVLMRVLAGSLRMTDDLWDGATNVECLRKMIWLPFYTAADFLLDILVHVQNEVKLDAEHNKKRNKVKTGDLEVKDQKGLMGGIESERGGASLVFESPLDNLSIFNARWLKNIILYAVELLFYEEKWERVVDIILRFNAFSRGRYAEQVLPMLIVAQHKLRERIEENGGPSKSQPIINVSSETGVAEEIFIRPAEYPSIEPAVHIDPEGHNVYSGSKDALRLVSVPLDINKSMHVLHNALEIKHHTARALQHSRQLLLCYLAGQLDGNKVRKLTRGSSRVGFVPSQIKPPSDVPPDMMDEFFEATEDVQTYALLPSQLAVVISSYNKTIEMLQFRQQKGLAAQAMYELGNITFHTGNIRAAYKWWAEALDTILNMTDALKNWRDILPPSSDPNSSSSPSSHQSNPNSMFLQRCGLWGCLLGGVLASNIAQYIHTSHLGLRLDCCLLSASLFKALFCSSLPHPTADKDYALYDIGLDREVKQLVPGIDLLSEPFRGDGRSVVAALRWVTEELARARHLVMVLPLLTLCQYFTTHVCRDLQRSVDVRILRVRVLTDLGMFSEAIQVLLDLLHGERLPRNGDICFRTVEAKSTLRPFDNKEPLLEQNNVEVLNDLLDRRLPPSLAVLYGQNLTSKLTIVHARLLVAIATTIFAIPANVMEDVYRHLSLQDAEAQARSVLPPSTVPPPTQSKNSFGKKIDDDAWSISRSSQIFTERKGLIDIKIATSETVKGFLLSVAEVLLNNLCEAITDSQEESLTDESVSLMPADLELLCLARLELSQVATQRQHALTGGGLVYSAMRALEDAAILNELDVEKRSNTMMLSSAAKSSPSISPSVPGTHYLSSQARGRLDARLWLSLRLALAKALSGEDSGMGKLGGTTRSVTASIGSCAHHCRQGLDEAEAFGDSEMMAEFLVLSAVHDLQQGKITEELLQQLEDAIQRLEQTPSLSFSGQLLLALSIIQYADIKGSRDPSDVFYLQQPLTAYKQAQNVLLNQMMLLGEKIDVMQMAPVQPSQNIYLHHLQYLAQIKLRLGLVNSHAATEDRAEPQWRDAVKELELGLELTRTAACQQQALEAQLLINIGQIQSQLFNLGHLHAYEVSATLVETIRTTYASDHNLGLMKQAYMEIALVLLQNVEEIAKEVSFTAEVPSTPETTKPKLPSKTSKLSKKDKEERERRQKELKERKRELEKERKRAWSAIRAAGLVSTAQHRLGLLTGDVEITALHIPEKSGKAVPDFALFDLLGTDDVLGENDSYVTKGGIVALGTSVNSSNHVQITWLHLLGYLSFLRRQCSYAALGVSTDGEGNTRPTRNGTLIPLFSCNKVLKLSRMHAFLKSELELYSIECCGVYPPDMLAIPTSPSRRQSLISHASLQDTSITGQQEELIEKRKDPLEKSERNVAAAKASDLEICVQWCIPELDPPELQQGAERDVAQDAMYFVYALNKTAVSSLTSSSSPVVIGKCVVPLAPAQSLHEKLMSTLEIAEADLQPASQPTGATSTSRVSRTDLSVTQASPEIKRKRRTMGIKALSARQRRDDRCRAKLKEHIEGVNQLLAPSKPAAEQEVPFEVSVYNTACLEGMFDPSRGYIGKTTEYFFDWFSGLLEN